ncbi:ankyrin repeat domain-containing protein [bacterium]|nr:MAG: ankyrin repeat domain-containing protein [bacterium]
MNKKFLRLWLLALALTSNAMPATNIFFIPAEKIETQHSPLFKAALNGDVNEVRTCINRGDNIDQPDIFNTTPIHVAIAHNHSDCVLELLSHNADITIPDIKDGWTPLHTAVNVNNLDIVQALLNHGADVNAKILVTEDSCNKKISGKTPLHVAVMIGNAECVKMLLAHNPNIFAQDDYSQTVLYVAVRYFHADCLMLLLEHLTQKKAYLINNYGHAGNREFIAELIAAEASVDPKDNNGNTLLHYAAFEGCIEAAAILIKNGANLFARNNKSHTPLDVALYAGREIASILQAKEKVTSENLTEVVERLAMAQYLEQRMKTLIS